MKLFKKSMGIVLSILIAASVFIVPTAVSAAETVNKTLTQYMGDSYFFSASENDEYECKVENNNEEYIKTDFFQVSDGYWLTVNAYKPTKTVKPLITVMNGKTGEILKKYKITVTAVKKIKVSNVKMNKGVWKEIHIKNPYFKEHKFSYNKKIIKIKKGGYGNGNGNWIHTVKGLKKGTTTVKVKLALKGPDKLISSFKITVGDYKASLKKSFKKCTIKYNKHLKHSYNLDENGSIDIGEAVKNFHSNSVISVKIKNKKIAATCKSYKTETTPKAVAVYGLKTGKTKVDVYEKRGKAKKKKIGTINITVKRAKDSEVYGANRALDNDGIFYEFFVQVGDKIDLKTIVTKRYINTNISSFKDDEYKFTFKASPAEVITVDQNGIYTILSDGNNDVDYTITFADGSKVSGGGSFDIVDDDFFS